MMWARLHVDLIPRFRFLLDDLTVAIDAAALRARPRPAPPGWHSHCSRTPLILGVTRWLKDWIEDLSEIDRQRLVGVFSILRVSVTPVDVLVRFAATVGPVAEELP